LDPGVWWPGPSWHRTHRPPSDPPAAIRLAMNARHHDASVRQGSTGQLAPAAFTRHHVLRPALRWYSFARDVSRACPRTAWHGGWSCRRSRVVGTVHIVGSRLWWYRTGEMRRAVSRAPVCSVGF
jgi:hypothetical protein